MNFSVVSLLSLLSFTSLVTSPAICMNSDSDEDSGSGHTSSRSPRSKSPAPVELDLDSLVITYDALRFAGNGASEVELIAYLAGKSWSTMGLDQQEKTIAQVKAKSTFVPSTDSEDLAFKTLVAQHDALRLQGNGASDEELVEFLAGTLWTSDVSEQEDLIARVLKASTIAPKAATPVASSSAHSSRSPSPEPKDDRDESSSASRSAHSSRSASPIPTAAAASADDSAATPPAKVVKTPLDAGIMGEIDAYTFKMKALGSFSSPRKGRNVLANSIGSSKELANHISYIRGILAQVITFDPTLNINSLKDAESFAGARTSQAFTNARANLKTTLPNKVTPSELLLEVATLVQNIYDPSDLEAQTVRDLFIDVLADQGDCSSAALAGRLGYVYSVAFDYLVQKYNAGI